MKCYVCDTEKAPEYWRDHQGRVMCTGCAAKGDTLTLGPDADASEMTIYELIK